MRDPLPPTRPDVAVLFGAALPDRGVQTLIVGQQLEGAGTSAALPGWKTTAPLPVGQVAAHRLGAFARPLQDLRGLWRVRGRAFDIVQVRDKIRTGWLMSWYARLTGKPFVYWMSFPFVESYAERWAVVGRSRGRAVWWVNGLRARLASWLFYGQVAPSARHLFVQSDAMLAFMHGRGIARERMTAVPMGVNVPVFQAVAASDEIRQRFAGRRAVCYSGMLERTRQSDFLVEVIRRVRQQVPEALLVLAGDADSPDEAAWIRQRIRELGAEDDVWLTGWLPQAQALSLVKASELGLSPIPRSALYDVSSPTKVAEYLALGVPCVANDIPDQQFVIQQSGGGLCVPMDVARFADAVVRLLQDPVGARAMGHRGARWVIENRSYESIGERVAAVYQGLLDAPRTRMATT